MNTLNWDYFKYKNKNYTEEFENLCYHLFCRKFKISNGIIADYNEAGLETKPIFSDDKWYGFQAKFFETSIDYSQIMKSIEKAIDHFKNNPLNKEYDLDVIYVYLNKKMGLIRKNSVKLKIEKFASKKNVKIEWIVPSNFEILLNNKDNFDLNEFYFGSGKFYKYILDNTNNDIITLIKSDMLLEIPIKNNQTEITDIVSNSNNKTILIEGYPGSGKTILMNKIFYNYLSTILKANNTFFDGNNIPMIINLRECFNVDLENIIRNRQNDYGIRNTEKKYIYLLDGLDEISEYYVEKIFNSCKVLINKPNTKKIIFSCRKGNVNKYSLIEYFPEVFKIELDRLCNTHINTYFESRKNEKKINYLKNYKNKELLNEIKDIYLLEMFYNNIEKLDNSNSIYDFFELTIISLIEKYKHNKNISSLNLPVPKKDNILKINKEISFEFNKKFQFRFILEEIQKLIMNLYPKLTYREIDDIINYLASSFWDINIIAGNYTYFYHHKRIFEYFLVLKLKEEYESNRYIIREKNIINNMEFFENFFLKYLRTEYTKEKNLKKILELNLIDVYLGKNSGFGADEPCYTNTDSFPKAVASINSVILGELLNDENLNLSNKIVATPKIIQMFYENNNYYWKSLLKEYENEFKISVKDEKQRLEYQKWEEFEYWLFLEIIIKKKSEEDIFNNVIRKNYSNETLRSSFMNEESGLEKLIKSFFRLLLRKESNFIVENIDKFDNKEIEFLLQLFSIPKYLIYLFKIKNLYDKVKEILEGINSKALNILFLKNIMEIKLDEEEIKFCNEQNQKIININHYYELDKNLINYSMISCILDHDVFNKPNKYMQSVVLNRYFYSSLYKGIVNVLKKKIDVRTLIREYIEILNILENDKELFYLPKISFLWSEICNIVDSRSFLEIKDLLFKNKLYINKFSFYFHLKRINPELFKKIVYQEEIDEFLIEMENWKEDYQSFVERCLDLSIFYSDINEKKQIYLVEKALTHSILKHNWRKDTIVSYSLIEAFEVLWDKKWLSITDLNRITLELFDLSIKVTEITDGKNTWEGPYNLIKVISYYNLQLAIKLRDKLFEKEGSYLAVNEATYYVIKGMISNCSNIQSIDDELEYIIKEYNYNYDNKPREEYFEYHFNVYLLICTNDFYTTEERKNIFYKLYGLVEEVLELGINDFFNRNLKNVLTYRKLCETYKKTFQIDEFIKEDNEINYEKIEEDFIKEVLKVKEECEIKELYKKLSDYEQNIVLENDKSWQVLVEQTNMISGNLKLFIEYLNENYYLKGNYTANSKYMYFGIGYALKFNISKEEIENYIYKNSGYYGFNEILKVFSFLEDKKNYIDTFNNFLEFCKFLVYERHVP